MRRSVRYTARLLVFVAVLASLHAIAPGAAAPGTPYLSALSIAVTPLAHAAGSCPDKQCISNKCQHVVGWTCGSSGPGSFCERTTQCV